MNILFLYNGVIDPEKGGIQRVTSVLADYFEGKGHTVWYLSLDFYKKETPDKNEYPPINSLIIGIDIDRELRREKITRRLYSRLEEGMVEEVQRLLATGITPEDLIYYGLEYKYLTLYITGKLSYDEMVDRLEIAIHQFAKRQMTWFRGMEKRGFKIHWLKSTLPTNEKIEQTLQLINDI